MKKILLCLVLLLLVTGCGNQPKLENGQEAVVSLNDGMISVDELYQEMKDSYAIGILLDMVDERILAQKYPESDEEKEYIDNQIQTWLLTFKDQATLLQVTQSKLGISTMDGLRSYLSLQFKENKAIEDYVKSLVTDKEIQKYYDDKVFGDIKARHILITSEATSSMTESEKSEKEAEALQKAKDIIARLDNGEDFSELAKEFSSDDSNKDNGGDLGYFSTGEMVEEFETAAKKLEVGSYTKEPVKTTYGYHIILKDDEKEKAPLDQWTDKIRETLANQKLEDDATLQVTALMELRKEAGMSIVDDNLKDQYDLLMQQMKDSLRENNN